MALQWHETAPGLLYEAEGDNGRRYVVAFDGERWTLDLFQHSEYEAEQQIEFRDRTSQRPNSGVTIS
jgi:hypothetical protein